MIPRTLVRTVPSVTTEEVETWWARAVVLCRGWQAVTYRDPIEPALFPLTADAWSRCTSGAQRAGLIRLEALWRHGGIYLDSDVELHRSLEPLVPLEAFAAWEDERTVPDAVLGAAPGHPAIERCLQRALAVLEDGPWASGPGITTEVLPGRSDVLLLPPASFYPYHYSERHRRHEDHRHPYTFGAHHWAASWLSA